MNQGISEKQDSFIQLLHRNVKKFPNKLAICDENNEITLTKQKILCKSRQFYN